jgi:prolyl 4-hydroxylase
MLGGKHQIQHTDYSSKFTLIDCMNEHKNDKGTEEPHNPLFPNRIHLRGEEYADKFCASIDKVLSHQECEKIMNRAKEAGYKAALVNVGKGREVSAPDTRQSERCIIDDAEFAGVIFNRIQHCLPAVLHDSSGLKFDLVGLNERMRILRYSGGGFFKPHYDGSYHKSSRTFSFLTLMIYLNSGGGVDFEGGTTNFLPSNELDDGPATEFVPSEGGVLAFHHRMLHEGAAVIRGTKCCIRTDIMYTRRSYNNYE